MWCIIKIYSILLYYSITPNVRNYNKKPHKRTCGLRTSRLKFGLREYHIHWNQFSLINSTGSYINYKKNWVPVRLKITGSGLPCHSKINFLYWNFLCSLSFNFNTTVKVKHSKISLQNYKCINQIVFLDNTVVQPNN